MPSDSRQVQLIQLENKMIVPAMNGRLYCSRRDPVKESEVWFHAHKVSIRSAKKVLILGLGAGFHLMNFEPQDEIFVLELNPELIEIFNSRDLPMKPRIHFINPQEQMDASVFEFRPAWLGFESQYQSLSRQFRQQDVKSLQQAAERSGHLMLSEILQKSQWPENYDLSIKDITSAFPLEDQSQEAKIWRTLRELVL